MQGNLTVIAIGTAMMVFAIFIMPSDSYYEESPSDLHEQDGNISDSVAPCDLSNVYNIIVLRGKEHTNVSYMFVDLPSNESCCNVATKQSAEPIDVRGKS